MGVLNRDTREIQARIIYFGPPDAGTTTNLQFIHRKLRREHRGELRSSSAPSDASARYEFLPVQLGPVRGYQTSIHLYTLPGGPEHKAVRREILEGVDGVVFVADVRPERHAATVAAAEELRGHLASYGRSLDDLVLIVQYNRRDCADENALDALHRQLRLKPAACFEAVSNKGTGVLQTLTTLSKLILQRLRRQADEAEAEPPRDDRSHGGITQPVEATVLVEEEPAAARAATPPKGFRVESAGPVEGSGGELRIPVRLVREGSGERVSLLLRLALEEA